jgi:Na+-translocating ferredoxin:NAD+ oxidoreductase subunit D
MTKEDTAPQKILSPAPHIHATQSVSRIMWLVIIALLPATINAIVIFGTHSLWVICTAIIAALLAETVIRYLLKRTSTIGNGSAILTGLLLAMNVPPEIPLWMVALGSFFAIIIVKELFGGLGYNIFNPALAGRAFLMASWPTEMTTLWHPFHEKNILTSAHLQVIDLSQKAVDTITQATGLPQKAIDTITQATPLGLIKEMGNYTKELNISADSIYNALLSKSMFKALAWGNIGGCIGETSAVLLFIGALFLLIRKIITWHIPVSFIGTFALVIYAYYSLSGFYRPGAIVLYHILSGGLFLGAFFMATDMVTSPITDRGMLIFGCGCGLLAAVIRIWGGYPEGVSYAILLMNTTVPLFDRIIKPRIFGTRQKELA